MIDLEETIVAIATPPCGGARGIIRLAGPSAWEIAGKFFHPDLTKQPVHHRPQAVVGTLSLPSLTSDLPATLYLFRAPRSYTGENMVEIHTVASPPVLELALSVLAGTGARLAMPGEFTMRGFLNGKLDLTAAEAVLGLIDAETPEQAAVARKQLAGGIARRMYQLRDRLLDLLAELEAGLDFPEEGLEFLDRSELQATLEATRTELDSMQQQMQSRTVSDNPRRVVLVGRPNVGKSSLFNVLLGEDAAMVSRVAGTTRDYLVGKLELSGTCAQLVDTAGIDTPSCAVEQKAQSARAESAGAADLLLWCIASTEAASAPTPAPHRADEEGSRTGPHVLVVLTKTDLVRPSQLPQLSDGAVIPVSVTSEAGLRELRSAIMEWARCSERGQVVPATAARCHRAVAAARAAVARALKAITASAGDELIALDLRLALEELGHVVGAVYTDDILDRIFSRFCIGK